MKCNFLNCAVLALSLAIVACSPPSDQPSLTPDRGDGSVQRVQTFVDDTPIETTEAYEGPNLKLYAPQWTSPGMISLTGTDARVLFATLQTRPQEVKGDGKTYSKGSNKVANQMKCFERIAMDGTTATHRCILGIDYVAGTVAGFGNNLTNTSTFHGLFNPHAEDAGRPVVKAYRGSNLSLAPKDGNGVAAGSITLLGEDARRLFYAMSVVKENDVAGSKVKDSGAVKCVKASSTKDSKVTFACQILFSYAWGEVINSSASVDPAVAEL